MSPCKENTYCHSSTPPVQRVTQISDIFWSGFSQSGLILLPPECHWEDPSLWPNSISLELELQLQISSGPGTWGSASYCTHWPQDLDEGAQRSRNFAVILHRLTQALLCCGRVGLFPGCGYLWCSSDALRLLALQLCCLVYTCSHVGYSAWWDRLAKWGARLHSHKHV